MAERRYVHNNRLYVIRDRFVHGRFVTCQFATLNRNGSKKWSNCAEGVEFAAIEPMRVRRAF